MVKFGCKVVVHLQMGNKQYDIN